MTSISTIVSIYDFITVGARGYIVMEYVQGKTLEQIMEEQGRPGIAQWELQQRSQFV